MELNPCMINEGGEIRMGMFGSKEEKIRCFEENVSSQGGSICEYFGDFSKDLSGIDFQINIFLKEHPNYKITTMTSSIGPLGANVLCVFERKDIDKTLLGQASTANLSPALSTTKSPSYYDESVSYPESSGEDSAKESIYSTAIALMEIAEDSSDIQKAIDLLDCIDNYKDAIELKEELRKKIESY